MIYIIEIIIRKIAIGIQQVKCILEQFYIYRFNLLSLYGPISQYDNNLVVVKTISGKNNLFKIKNN